MAILLVGVKHSGKSTLGRLLAHASGRFFADSDTLLAELYARTHEHEETHDCACVHDDLHASMVSPRVIMQKHGERFFRELEAQAVREFALQPMLDNTVLALGGGTADNVFLTEFELKQLGFCIYLAIDFEGAWTRILQEKELPAFLQCEDPRAQFLEQCQKRDLVYRRIADAVVPVEPLALPEENLRRIMQTLRNFGVMR